MADTSESNAAHAGGGAERRKSRRRGPRRIAVPLMLLLVALASAGVALGAADERPASSQGAAPAPPPPAPDGIGRERADDARELAKQRGEKVEVTGLRKADETTYANPNGTMTKLLFDAPIRTRRDGQWEVLDPTLVATPGGVRPKVPLVDVEFSGGGTGPAARIEHEGRAVELGFESRLPTPRLEGRIATYPNVLPGVDLELEPALNGFTERFILHRRPPVAPRYRFPLKLTGLKAELTPDERLRLLDRSGNAISVSPPARMWGAERDPRTDEPTRSAPLDLRLIDTPDGQVLEIVPDPSFLRDPSVKLPITVDPWITFNTGSSDTYVQSDLAPPRSGDWELRSGSHNGSALSRSYLRFFTDQLRGTNITNAHLNLLEFFSATCTPSETQVHRVGSDWGAGIGWGNQPWIAEWRGFFPPSAYGNYCRGREWVRADLTALVRDWAGGTPNYGVVLRAGERDWRGEKESWRWKKFRSWEWGAGIPYLGVEYNSYPYIPEPQSPGNYSETGNLTPTLVARHNDADGHSGFVDFEVREDNGTWVGWGRGNWTGSGGTSSWTIPAGWLRPNVTYKWRAHAMDDQNDWSRGGQTGDGFSWEPRFTARSRPHTPEPLSPGHNTDTGSLTPTLRARHSDPDNHSGFVDFEVREAGGAWVGGGRGTSTGSGGTSEWTVPRGWLRHGVTYKWRGRAQDERGDESGWSWEPHFNARSTPPRLNPPEHVGLPGGWFNDATPTARLTGHDDDDGVQRIVLDSPSRGWSGPERDYQCAGLVNQPKPLCLQDPASAELQYNTAANRLPEGVVPIRARAIDPSGLDASATWEVKVDHTQPTISSLEGGALRPGALVGPGQHELVIGTNDVGAANAQNSGVKSVGFRVDGGAWTNVSPDCQSGSCPAQRFTVDTSNSSNGRHTVETRANDGVSLEAGQRSFEFIVDRAGPQITSTTGPLRERRYLKAASYDLRVEAQDGGPETAGVTKMELLVDGQVPPEPDPLQPRSTKTWTCPGRGCSQGHTFSLDAGALSQGAHDVSVRVSDAVGNPTTSTSWPVVVDHEAPQVTPTGPLKDMQDQTLLDPEYRVRVDASDGSLDGPRAGVERVDLLVDDLSGTPVPHGPPLVQTCPQTQSSCPLAGDLTLRAADLEDGLYEVTTRATDRAGNFTDVTWEVFDDTELRNSLDLENRPGFEIERTADSRTYVDEDGVHEEVVRESAGYFEDGQELSQVRDNTLELLAGGQTYRNRVNDYVAEISKDAAGPVRYTSDPATADEVFVTTRLAGARGQAAPPEGNALFFDNVFGPTDGLGAIDSLTGVDLRYRAEEDVLSEELVFGTLALATPTAFTFDVDYSPQLRPVKAPDGGIDFLDAAGEPRLALHPPVMADESRSPGGFSRAATWSLSPSGPGRATATMEADRTWLASPARMRNKTVRWKVGRKGGKGSWDPTRRVLSYGTNVWGQGECCERSRARGTAGQHPEEQDFARIGRDGLEYTRTAVFPCTDLDEPEGRPTFETYDRYFEETARKKVQVLPFVQQGVNCVNATKVDVDSNAPDTDAEYTDMYNTGAQLASRYGPGGSFWVARGCDPGETMCGTGAARMAHLPVRAWQFWNEPNMESQWQTPEGRTPDDGRPGIDPDDYREALRHFRNGLRSEDSEARVVVAGLSAFRDDVVLPEGLPARTFLSQLINDGSTERKGDYNCMFDAVAMHIYRYDLNFAGQGGVLRAVDYFQKKFRNVLTRNGAETMQTWVTEYGAQGIRGESGDKAETTQRNWVSAFTTKLRRYRTHWKLGPLIHFVWQDNSEFKYKADDAQGRGGQIRPAALTGLWREPGVNGVTDERPAGMTTNRKAAGAFAATEGRRRTAIKLPPRRGAPGTTPQGPTCS